METDEGRRRALKIVAGVCAVAATGSTVALALSSMSPTPDEQYVPLRVDLRGWEPGTVRTVQWSTARAVATGAADAMTAVKEVLILRRTPRMIEDVKAVTSKDPEADSQRVKHPEWLVVYPICTHLGCKVEWRPVAGPAPGQQRRSKLPIECPCHESFYDASGRIVSGPAPKNLRVPPHYFEDEETLIVGADGPGAIEPRPS